MQAGFRFLEHMADIYVEAYGPSLAEAYEQAGIALFRTLIPEAEGQDYSKKVTAQGFDYESLLYNWLEALLLLFELDGLVGTSISAKLERNDDTLHLTGDVRGVRYNPAIHKTGRAVKSPTYWLMEVVHNSQAILRFVLDI